MSLIYVAGSGPSSKGYDFAHVVTKKKTMPHEYRVLPRANWVNSENQGNSIVWTSYEGRKRWADYYEAFRRGEKWKPSNGLQAVFFAIDRYEPKEIALIGFDNVLDAAKPTLHDWPAELECIKSLTRIVDFR